MKEILVKIARKTFTDKETGEVKRYYEFVGEVDGNKVAFRPHESKRALVNYILDKNFK